MEIRSLGIEHFDEIIRVWNEAGLSHRPLGRDSKEEMGRVMAEDPALHIGALIDGKLVGVCIGTDDLRKGWINRLAVVPEHQRKGIASALIGACEEVLEKRGRRIHSTLIEDDVHGSRELFERLGYEVHTDIVYVSKRLDPDV